MTESLQEIERLVDDLVYAGRIIERYENPIYRPLSEENFRQYDSARRAIATNKSAITRVVQERDVAVSALHERQAHPDYEYRTTSGQRKCWDGEPDLTKDGWELNKTKENPDAFERFDYHEEICWRRKTGEKP